MTPEDPKFPDSPIAWESDARFFLARLPVLMPNSTAEGIINVNALLERAHELIREARNQALEEAATMVDGMYKGLAHNRLYRDMANEISPRIRKLKHKDSQP